MSIDIITRHAQRSPLTEVRESRAQRALQTGAVLSGIIGVTFTAIAFVTVGLGA